ncbi:MAG: hypothetical protein ABEJ98_06030 [Candidatus Nanohaloarchaea archaeon]
MSKDLEERIEDLERRVRKIEEEKTRKESGSGQAVPLEMSDFKKDFDPKTYADKATIVARYLEKHEGKENFDTDDLNQGFKLCKWKRPANMSDIVSKAAGSKELFMSDGEKDGKKKWMLTETGEKHVEDLR